MFMVFMVNFLLFFYCLLDLYSKNTSFDPHCATIEPRFYPEHHAVLLFGLASLLAHLVAVPAMDSG
jgi:hypothetical protein